MRFISSASLGSQNISSSLLSATYTATAVDAITTRLFAAGIAGSANYLAFATLQRLGTGSTYQVIPVTSASVEKGTTAIALTTIPVPVDNTDILKVYIVGASTDTTSPSLWTYFYGESTCTLLADSALTAAAIASSAFTNAKFATGAIGIDTMAGSVIAASTFAGSAIGNAAIASCALANNVFKAGAFGADTLGASALSASNIATGAITATTTLGASAISASNIAGSAFDSTVFKTGALGVGVLGASVLAASNIGGSAFDSTVFKSNAISVGVLGASVLAASNIGGSAFNSTVFKSGAIDAAAIATSAITSDEFAQSAADKVWLSGGRTLTQSAVQVTSILSGSTITIQRGDSFTISFTGLGSIVDRSELWFTAKSSRGDADSNSKVMVTEGSGLRYINGSVPSSSNNGAIVVSDAVLGNIAISVIAAESACLMQGNGIFWDTQVKRNSGSVNTLSGGIFNVAGDVTRAT